MRWPVILTLCLAASAVGLEQSQAVAQINPYVARACGGCNGAWNCRPRLFPRFCGRRCRGFDRGCTGMIPSVPSCAAPPQINCAPPPVCPPPVCPQVTTRLRPRRVVNWEMCPQTVYRQQTYCEQIPVTTYRRVVMMVPQTECRTVVRRQMVPTQTMVPRRRVSCVWEPYQCLNYAPAPICNDPCTDMNPYGGAYGGFGNTISPNPMIGPSMSSPMMAPSQPTLTVPSVPDMDSTYDPNNIVPTPADIDQQSRFTPWMPVPQKDPYFQANNDGYRTLQNVPRTAGKFNAEW